jgi:hypothetical protein
VSAAPYEPPSLEVAVGEIAPRVMTPPNITGPPGPCSCGCALTRDTSYGFDVIDFAAEDLGVPLEPWQQLAVIHAGELLPDGRPRFRRVVVVVARQNGKTFLLIILALYWMFIEQKRVILGTSTQTKYAAEPWAKAHAMALESPDLEAELPPGRLRGMRKKAGEEEWRTVAGSRYVITPSNEEGGRSLTLDRVMADELSRQFSYGAYNAAYYAMRAVPDAQYFGLTTPLDARSVVFNDFRTAALQHIADRSGDDRLCLLEWSAPADADPLDRQALAYANPSAGRRYPFEDLVNEARTAVAAGGDALSGFRCEAMCITAQHADPAISTAAWAACLTIHTAVSFSDLRGKVALCFDVAPSMLHATLYAAAEQPDGRVRIGPVKEWTGAGCADRAGRELPALVAKVNPRAFGVLPAGPAAAVMSGLAANRPGVWPPRGVAVDEIRGELTQVAMGFAALVDAHQVARAAEPLIDGQVAMVEKLPRGDAWVFSRRGAGDCDAVYAAAGAAHLARGLPPATVVVGYFGRRDR